MARAIVAAAAFLTRLPVDRRGVVGPADVARGVVVFPVVGAAIGGIVALVAWLFAYAFPPGVAAIGAVTAEIVLTGGLHLDGLADTFDGYGGDSRERALEIMRDHTIGVYGVAAIAVDLIGKTVVIAALVEHVEGLWMVIAAGAISRGVVGVLGSVEPYARPNAGIGGVLGEHGRTAWALYAGFIGAAIASVTGGVRGIIACGIAVAVGAGWAWTCRRRLGGMTGDTLGASVELTEIVVLLIGVAYR